MEAAFSQLDAGIRLRLQLPNALFGAGELLVTSMDGDGTQAGYDLALTRAIADAVRVPVVASGGVVISPWPGSPPKRRSGRNNKK